ncbi:ribose-phosphate pyrophosphokinase [Candidatus Woesearchaeota archaeon CG08_land_8_20_14_0_20_47_9]|nr:MAG: ribose-phosphate pyrophosphokinase [Candidatus Woesearchaeota archaeon CG1_02_47_18]PIN72577.1 MAG: ribose-phosphate pyrophosphokinase [Candidatus Woesearchaeota archaeon CG10_big_fil_rev_8_21_14_0_10_47_5]PIO03158.1 MAG: ribose-phosphate pyrophosphokinase [Candidatus Woesearchaeota archaeon CG08_land_8_20_14_0_20_47_9]HII30139.1 ribose-phosphate pyrophosphokinase [Candidatus Woesearchaeota archaeon]
MAGAELKLFSGNAHRELAGRIASLLNTRLGDAVVSRFPNGETRVQIMESVRNSNVFIIQPTCPPVNEHIMELLIMADAMRRAAPLSIVAVIPYFGYAKQDKRKSGREPITAKLVAALIKNAGVGHVVTVDLHSEQIEGFFNMPVENLPVNHLISDYIKKRGFKDVVVVSPDTGGAKRARKLAELLNTNIAVIDKHRSDYSCAKAIGVVGEVEGKTAIIFDDFIDTGSTMVEAVNAVAGKGARSVVVCCTHPLLTGQASEKLAASHLSELVVTDTIPVPEEKRIDKLHVISVAEMLATVIRNLHSRTSISGIFPHSNSKE